MNVDIYVHRLYMCFSSDGNAINQMAEVATFYLQKAENKKSLPIIEDWIKSFLADFFYFATIAKTAPEGVFN